MINQETNKETATLKDPITRRKNRRGRPRVNKTILFGLKNKKGEVVHYTTEPPESCMGYPDIISVVELVAFKTRPVENYYGKGE